MADIGNMHAQLIPAAVEFQQADGVVNVLGLGRVDGEDGQPPQIHAVGDLLLGDGSIFKFLCLGKDFLGELLPHFPAIENGLGAFGCNLGGAEPLPDGNPVLRMAVAAQCQEGACLVAGADPHVLALFDKQLHAVAAVRLQCQAAVIGADNGTGQGVVGLGHLNDLALGAAFHTGMIEQADVDLVLGHGAVQRPSRNEDIPFPVVAAGKAEPGRQLDQRAANGRRCIFVFNGGQTGRILAPDHGQGTFRHHARDGVAQTVAVHLQLILQFPQVEGPLPDGLENVFL